MRLFFLTFLGSIFFATMSSGQNEPKFLIEVSKTTVQAGEPFEVTFILENIKNGRFIPPDWTSTGLVMLGSSQSSSFSLSNGASISAAEYHYQMMTRDTGLIEIPAATVKQEGEELHTAPQSIHVIKGDGNFMTEPPMNDEVRPAPPPTPKKKIKTIRL